MEKQVIQLFFKRSTAILFLLFLISCEKQSNNKSDQPSVFSEPSQLVGENIVNVLDNDVLGGLLFQNTNKYNNKPYGALIVDKSNGYPVYDGTKSARFEVRSGDCGWNDTFNDCTTDRSRSEVYELNPPSILGKTVTYTEKVFIPVQEKFRPAGNNLLVLSQINYSDINNAFGALAYLVMENNNTLLIRTHKDFTWDWNHNYTISSSPFNKWINLKYQIKISNLSDGEIRVYVDNNLLFSETRPTVITANGLVFLKMGIYNSFRSQATEAYSTQIIYIDGISKRIE